MVSYSKQNVLVERRTEGLSGGLSNVPWRPRLAVVPDLQGPNVLTFDFDFDLKSPRVSSPLALAISGSGRQVHSSWVYLVGVLFFRGVQGHDYPNVT